MNENSEVDSVGAKLERKMEIDEINKMSMDHRHSLTEAMEYQNKNIKREGFENERLSGGKLIETISDNHSLERAEDSQGNSDETVDTVHRSNGEGTEMNQELNGSEDSVKEVNASKIIPDVVDEKTLAILQFSDTLADNIIQEAILINEIYIRDKMNIDNLTEDEALDRERNIKKTLFPNDNGVINGRMNDAGYDSYLLDKLLRSKPDPEEIPTAEGFDGNEEHFKRDQDTTYPGLDCEDAYARAHQERPESDRDLSDNNNNEIIAGLVEPLDDNVLQTIHEDAELVIDHKDPRDVNEEEHAESTTKENETTDEHAMDVKPDDCIDEGVVEDVSQHNDETDAGPAMTGKEIEEPDGQPGQVTDKEFDEIDSMQGHMMDNDGDDDDDNMEESDCCDMTYSQKKAMVMAVRKGDIDRLEQLLEKKNADMNMIWYGENLLMVAIRSRRHAMCEFLIDNGINLEHETRLLELDEDEHITVHKMTARQMAYDLEMLDIVEILDSKSNNLFPFIVPTVREPRLRRPIIPFCPPPLDEAMKEEAFMDQEERLAEHKQLLKELARKAAEEQLEKSKAEKLRKSVTTAGDKDDTFRTANSNHLCYDDEISQVFGPDEGYETMSPDLSRGNRHFYHVMEPANIRSTRAFNLKKAYNASRVHDIKRSESPDYPMFNHNNTTIDSVGSYSFESRYWHMPKSAPPVKNYSLLSLNDPSVHIGLPFVHGDSKRKPNTPIQSAKKNLHERRAVSAHTNISPFSQVAKLLEQSRLFSPLVKSRPSTSNLPAINNNRKTSAVRAAHTRINYIYANRNSAKHPRTDTFAERSDLLPRRKLKC